MVGDFNFEFDDGFSAVTAAPLSAAKPEVRTPPAVTMVAAPEGMAPVEPKETHATSRPKAAKSVADCCRPRKTLLNLVTSLAERWRSSLTQTVIVTTERGKIRIPVSKIIGWRYLTTANWALFPWVETNCILSVERGDLYVAETVDAIDAQIVRMGREDDFLCPQRRHRVRRSPVKDVYARISEESLLGSPLSASPTYLFIQDTAGNPVLQVGKESGAVGFVDLRQSLAHHFTDQ